MIPTVRLLQLFVLGYSIYASETMSLTSEGTVSGSWIDQSSVKLVCTMSPYTGILKWRFNSSDVAECTFNNCRQIATGDGAFMFGFDTANGRFAWVISPVDIKKHNRQLFECNDGTDTANVTAFVTDPDVSPKDTVNSCTNVNLTGVYISIWIAVFIPTGIVTFVLKRALTQITTELSQQVKKDLNETVDKARVILSGQILKLETDIVKEGKLTSVFENTLSNKVDELQRNLKLTETVSHACNQLSGQISKLETDIVKESFLNSIEKKLSTKIDELQRDFQLYQQETKPDETAIEKQAKIADTFEQNPIKDARIQPNEEKQQTVDAWE